MYRASGIRRKFKTNIRLLKLSLRSRRLDRSSRRKREPDAREGDTQGVIPSLLRVFSCAHYFQAPATQATSNLKGKQREGGGQVPELVKRM